MPVTATPTSAVRTPFPSQENATPAEIPQPTATLDVVGWAFVSPPTLRLWAQPGESPIATLHGGDRLDILGISPDHVWLWVRYHPAPDAPLLQGWASVADVRFFVEKNALPVASPGALEAAASSQGRMGIVQAQQLHLRVAPGVDQPIQKTLVKGEAVYLLGRSDTGQWVRVRTQEGVVGWVAARWLKPDRPISQLPVITSAASATASSFHPQGEIVFQTEPGGAIYAIGADGRGLRKLTTGLDPALSPDGQWLAFARWRDGGDAIMVMNLETGVTRTVIQVNKPRSPTWAPDGKALVYEHWINETVCRQTPFGCLSDDALRQRFMGQDCWTFPAPVGRVCIEDFPLLHLPRTGLQYVRLDGSQARDLPATIPAHAPRYHPSQPWALYLSRNGIEKAQTMGNEPPQPLVAYPEMGAPVYSPDGEFIFVSRKDGDSWNLWRYRADGAEAIALTHPPGLRDRPVNHVAPVLSPDGRFLLFLTDRRGPWELWIMDADGRNPHPFAPAALQSLRFRFDFGTTRMIDWQERSR